MAKQMFDSTTEPVPETPEADEAQDEGRRMMDPEIRLMGQMHRQLSQLEGNDPDAMERIVKYLFDRFVSKRIEQRQKDAMLATKRLGKDGQ